MDRVSLGVGVLSDGWETYPQIDATVIHKETICGGLVVGESFIVLLACSLCNRKRFCFLFDGSVLCVDRWSRRRRRRQRKPGILCNQGLVDLQHLSSLVVKSSVQAKRPYDGGRDSPWRNPG